MVIMHVFWHDCFYRYCYHITAMLSPCYFRYWILVLIAYTINTGCLTRHSFPAHLLTWRPVHAGHATPPVVNVPFAQGRERNAAAGVPRNLADGYIRDEDWVSINSQQQRNMTRVRENMRAAGISASLGFSWAFAGYFSSHVVALIMISALVLVHFRAIDSDDLNLHTTPSPLTSASSLPLTSGHFFRVQDEVIVHTVVATPLCFW
ncbi:uncharacterized protein EDB91DRAFT_403536 [Suillus paluster]|uniref:uncharacterized protein n=1 Tax=Suillus paluster TaxID=48578 RepID=UPI001B885E6D|nr:uncharacterized protein EDB91DRAFT_403536 [Suillus paluster]KAG1753549.1 hypothetical protein EDB91DRAFT_403536 [Suillus paluster]